MIKPRKKLTTTIVTQVVTMLIALAASRGFDVAPDVQAAIIVIGMAIVAYIQKSYNLGQGIADQGKESKNGS